MSATIVFMQPPYVIALVQRRHVDLLRVSSALCRLG
ncbi:putative leader peptide [Amycolatopsis nigrescens]